MLNENKNIDQIFRGKLGDYEKSPPTFVWTNIKEKLDIHRKVRHIAMLKIVGTAAAIVLAFLAGWQLTLPTHRVTVQKNSIVQQGIINSSVDPSTNKKLITTDILSVDADKVVSNTSGLLSKMNRTTSLNYSSFASFAANTSFMDNNNHSAIQKPGELELFNSEKDFLDKLHQNFKAVKKLTDWISTFRSDSIIAISSNSKAMMTDAFKYNGSERPVNVPLNNPSRNNKGRWSMKAEFAPVF